jgi:uncharacterized protein (DUF1697 family)
MPLDLGLMPKTSPKSPPKLVALLRGINVGGKNILPMKDLVAIFVAAGCTNVQTYIQSGNVIFTASASVSARLPAILTARINKRFGYQVPVILRSANQLGKIIRNNPFLKAGAPENTLHVMFLAGLPAPQRVASLDPQRCPGDSFHLSGQEVFLHLPNGAGKSKLTNAWFDSRLATIGTTRNWRTALKLFELMQK